jgi:hypothetical protein
MSRHLTVHVIRPGRDIDNALRAGGYAAGDNPDPDPADYQLESITWQVAHALGWPLIDGADQWRVRVDGAGMDMHFHLVHSLGRTLWPEGFQPGDGSNRYNPNRFERDGGYALTKVSI